MTESEQNSATSMVGRTIAGRYTIRATIGSGGMGFVYRAIQSPIEREVALKVLRLDLAHQDGIAERFTREARAASRIQHPNAITIFEFGEDDGIFYLAMELLYGETLRQRMRREPPLETEHALDIFESMAGALAAAHRVGVVHRDLKPDNIFLAQFDGLGEVVKVLDFGLAKLLDRAADAEGLVTDVNLRLGTPRYMAPEQALGLQPIDARCDVYSLGLLLFEMLARRAPYIGEDGMEVLAQRLRREAPRLSQIAPERGFGEALEALVASMLLRDREHRPADANEVVTRLRELRKAGQVYDRQDERTDQNPAIKEVPAPYKPSPTPIRTRPASAAVAGLPMASQPGISGPVYVSPQQSGPRGVPMGLDDFDKPTVVILSGRHDTHPASLSDIAMASVTPTPGPPTLPQPAPRREEVLSGQPTHGKQRRPQGLNLSPRFIVIVLVIAAGAPLIALLVRWYQARSYHVESMPAKDEGRDPGVTSSSAVPPKTPPAQGEAHPVVPVPLATPIDSPPRPAPENHGERPRVCRIRLVSTPPGAKVERDGEEIGVTPMTDSMPYGGTPLSYRVSAAGYAPHEAKVTPDHRRTLTITLKQIPTALPAPSVPRPGVAHPGGAAAGGTAPMGPGKVPARPATPGPAGQK